MRGGLGRSSEVRAGFRSQVNCCWSGSLEPRRASPRRRNCLSSPSRALSKALVRLSTRWDLPGISNRTSSEGWMELPEFIEAALSTRLKWAPFLGKPDTVLDAAIGDFETGQCSGCGRTLAEPIAATASSAQEDDCTEGRTGFGPW